MGKSNSINIKSIHQTFDMDSNDSNATMGRLKELVALAMYEYYKKDKKNQWTDTQRFTECFFN